MEEWHRGKEITLLEVTSCDNTRDWRLDYGILTQIIHLLLKGIEAILGLHELLLGNTTCLVYRLKTIIGILGCSELNLQLLEI